MAEKRNNYCQLLGLNPLKENSYSVESILKKIEPKKGKRANERRTKQNDTDQRFKAERLVNATADMERIMKDSILRHKEFTDAVQELKGKSQKIRQDCVILTDGTYLVLPGVADPFTKKLHWEGVSKADIVKLAMISLEKKLENFNSKMLLQIHDELIFEVDESELEQVKQIVKYEMENVVSLKVPLIVDMEWGDSWGSFD